MKAYLTILVAVAALSAAPEARPAEPSKNLLSHLASSNQPTLLSHLSTIETSKPEPRKPDVIPPQEPTPADPPQAPALIGAWMEPVSGRVIHGCYHTTKKLAAEEMKPVVVLSRMSYEDQLKALEKVPADALIVVTDDAPEFKEPGVYQFTPIQHETGLRWEQILSPRVLPPAKQNTMLKPEHLKAPAPVSKTKARQASYVMPEAELQAIPVSEECANGQCSLPAGKGSSCSSCSSGSGLFRGRRFHPLRRLLSLPFRVAKFAARGCRGC